MAPDLLLLAAATGGWVAVTAGALVLTRFRRPAPGPESPEPPDDLPPWVVAYLVGGPGAEPTAAAAALLDLAARGAVVLEEQGDDPAMTTVRPGVRPPAPDPVETVVLQRVASRGRGGPVPVSALVARPGEQPTSEDDLTDDHAEEIRDAVVGAARARGLTRPRAGVLLRTLLVVAAAVPAGWTGFVVVDRSDDAVDPVESMAALGLVALVALLLPTWGLFRGERLTRRGRQAAQAWLGHGTALGRDEVLRAARPAQALASGHPLAYAHALGLTRVVDRAVRMGPGDRRLVWSSVGGRWRQVEVRYPRKVFFGAHVPWVSTVGLWMIGVTGATVYALYWVPVVADVDPDNPLVAAARTAGVAALVALVAWVLVRFVGSVAEIGAARTVTGEVLWTQVNRYATTENHSSVVDYHLVVDDGTSDRLTAWSLPVHLRDRAGTGDVVRMTVRPLSRRVMAVERVDAAVPHESPRPA